VENPGGLPVDAVPGDFANVTFRQAVRVSAGGKRLRLRLSNEGGADVLVLGAVHVAEAAADGTIVPGTDRVVTFAGQPGVVIPAGAPLLSDPVDLPTRALSRLYVSIHVPGAISGRAPRTLYQYVAARPGDATAQTALPGARLSRLPPLVTQVAVEAPATTRVLVTFGDSITEGATSTANAFRSWPDRLAERVASQGWAVVNAGISGNRLLRFGAGPSALARFDRDVLSVPGVRAVVLMEGINDIGRGFAPAGPTEPVSLEALKAAAEQVIARGREHGLRVIGATLTPYQGAAYASPAGETVRQAYNAWVRTGGAFDGVIDFDAVVADPADRLSIAPAYNIRDHLHPNDAGYRAMGDGVNLEVLAGR
jgi:lysophospholipase L1-like esterase